MTRLYAPRRPVVSLLVLTVLIGACGQSPRQKPATHNNQPGEDAGQDTRVNPGLDVEVEVDVALDAALDDALIEADGSDPGPDALPTQITTHGARFTGYLLPSQRVSLALSAVQGDKVVLWLRRIRETAWAPYMALERAGQSTPVAFANPRANVDAHIPHRVEDLATGFEFWYGGAYTLALENRSTGAGWFEFTLECKSGPCSFEAPQPNPALPGLSDAALRQAIRADHSRHVTIDYANARRHVFRTVDNHDGQVECAYTGTRLTTEDVPDPNYMNIEHSWPQSRGASNEPQKSNIHHLFPTRTPANDARAAYYFGDVTSAITWSEGGSRRGNNAAGQVRFEVRAASRGNIARAMFYFSVVYAQPIPADEEATLRAWHAQDPVDERERARNDAIAAVQNSRNPFIDFPQIVGQIADF
ncbi:MAG: endonuclease [Bradymonadaceae bacterium]|nr:endonuclease [Lujinxingiaceae bacterium]